MSDESISNPVISKEVAAALLEKYKGILDAFVLTIKKSYFPGYYANSLVILNTIEALKIIAEGSDRPIKGEIFPFQKKNNRATTNDSFPPFETRYPKDRSPQEIINFYCHGETEKFIKLVNSYLLINEKMEPKKQLIEFYTGITSGKMPKDDLVSEETIEDRIEEKLNLEEDYVPDTISKNNFSNAKAMTVPGIGMHPEPKPAFTEEKPKPENITTESLNKTT
jgi:hypothetical protein